MSVIPPICTCGAELGDTAPQTQTITTDSVSIYRDSDKDIEKSIKRSTAEIKSVSTEVTGKDPFTNEPWVRATVTLEVFGLEDVDLFTRSLGKYVKVQFEDLENKA
jgi:hypothetical protein